MSSGPELAIIPYGSIEQINSLFQAILNEARLKNNINRDSDFFVGPNGKVLPAKYKKWIGVSRRVHLMKKAKSSLLKNAVSQLYRPGSFIGDGGTASVIKFEKATHLGLGRNGNNHIQKGKDMIRYLDRIAKTPSIPKSDSKLAKQLSKKLRKAIYDK